MIYFWDFCFRQEKLTIFFSLSFGEKKKSLWRPQKIYHRIGGRFGVQKTDACWGWGGYPPPPPPPSLSLFLSLSLSLSFSLSLSLSLSLFQVGLDNSSIFFLHSSSFFFILLHSSSFFFILLHSSSFFFILSSFFFILSSFFFILLHSSSLFIFLSSFFFFMTSPTISGEGVEEMFRNIIQHYRR